MKNKKIIIVAVLLIVAVLIYLFWPNIKAMFSKSEPETQAGNSGNVNTSTSNTSNTGNTTNSPIVPIKVGDSVVAAKDGVKAYNEELSSVVKTYQKNQWIGLVTKNANGWLTVQDTAGNQKQVQKSNVKRA